MIWAMGSDVTASAGVPLHGEDGVVALIPRRPVGHGGVVAEHGVDVMSEVGVEVVGRVAGGAVAVAGAVDVDREGDLVECVAVVCEPGELSGRCVVILAVHGEQLDTHWGFTIVGGQEFREKQEHGDA